MVEVDKALFSIEPMIKIGDSLYHWSNVKSVQSMGTSEDKNDFIFAPSVTWQCKVLKFTASVISGGEANLNSRLDIGYAFENLSDHPVDFEFYLLIRPFQVNPYYQFLNLAGGVGKIRSIREEEGRSIIIDDKVILPLKKYDSFGAAVFDEGNMVDLLRSGNFPQNKTVYDQNGLANGVMKYSFHLKPGEHTRFFLMVPYYDKKSIENIPDAEFVCEEFDNASTRRLIHKASRVA